MEIHQVSLRPTDFFTANPSIDVPSNKNMASRQYTNGIEQNGDSCCAVRTNGANGVANGVH